MNYFKLFSFIITAITITACSSNGTIRLFDGEKNENEVVTFKLPAALKILEVDGKEIKSNIFKPDGFYQLQTLPGKHFLKAVYSEYWGTENLGDIETSPAFYFAIDARAGRHYIFRHNGPQDLVKATSDNTIRDIAIWIEDQSTSVKINPTNSQSYGGFMNNLLKNAEKVKVLDSEPVQLIESKSSAQINVTEQLKYWWELADEKQRQSFQQWVNSRP